MQQADKKPPVMLDVDLGFTKFKVSRQAIIIFTLFLFIAILSGSITLFAMRSIIVFKPVFIAIMMLYALIILGFAILIGYIFNCVIVGKCIVLSWVFVGLYAFAAFAYIAIALGIFTGEAIGSPAIIEKLKSISAKKKM
jgi:hypothetical protein